MTELKNRGSLRVRITSGEEELFCRGQDSYARYLPLLFFHLIDLLQSSQSPSASLTAVVETVVTHSPLHRSVRAELPHTAPTSGHDAKPLRWVGMSQFYWRKVTVHYTGQNAAKTFGRADCAALTHAAMHESLPSGSHSAYPCCRAQQSTQNTRVSPCPANGLTPRWVHVVTASASLMRKH